MKRAPRGIFLGEYHMGDTRNKWQQKYEASGEFRPPRKGEFYLSGAIITAYRAPNDLSTPFWIAKPHVAVKCPCCGKEA